MRSKLDDTLASTYHRGENWVEQPSAHHVLRVNTSQPIIRLDCQGRARSSEQKATPAPRPAQALIRQARAPVTEIGTAATGFFVNELDVETAFGRDSAI